MLRFVVFEDHRASFVHVEIDSFGVHQAFDHTFDLVYFAFDLACFLEVKPLVDVEYFVVAAVVVVVNVEIVELHFVEDLETAVVDFVALVVENREIDLEFVYLVVEMFVVDIVGIELVVEFENFVIVEDDVEIVVLVVGLIVNEEIEEILDVMQNHF